MRFVLLLVASGLLFFSAQATTSPADTAAVLEVSYLPRVYCLMLRQGWHYQAGNNPTWARPDFDVSCWNTIPVARVGRPLPARALAGRGLVSLAPTRQHAVSELDLGDTAGTPSTRDSRKTWVTCHKYYHALLLSTSSCLSLLLFICISTMSDSSPTLLIASNNSASLTFSLFIQ
jgi:hypothetical protein